MTDWLLVLGAIGVCAVLHALVESQEPPSATPRRNYDVLAPAGPQVGATRLTPAQRDMLLSLALDRRLFGAAAEPILVIRAEGDDGRQ